MQILILILQNISKNENHGGSSKNVKLVAQGLAKRGHSVTILCSREQGNASAFLLSDQVFVKPTLPYRESWQDTFLVPPYDLSSIVRQVRRDAEAAQRIVIFDSHFMYHDVMPTFVPLVWSLRDFTYVQALQGSFAFRRDIMITPSQYIADCFRDALGGWLPGIDSCIRVVRNGVDLEFFQRCDASVLQRRLGIDADDHPVLLYPHRPEDRKGIGEALGVAGALLESGRAGTTLVVMRGMDARTRPGVEAYYRDLEQKVARLGLTAAVRWCDWLPAHEMPQLYSLADVTLCLGDIVEASSNAALESLACQVPVIATDIACYRELPQAVIRVPPRDVPAAFWAVERLLDGAALQAPVAGRLEEKWDAALMVGTFCTLVEQAAIRAPLEVRLPDSQQAVRIPAWISDQGGRLYNEYSREFCDSAQLMTCWQLHNRQPFNFSLSDTDEVFAAEMQARGFFTPAAVQ